MTHRDFGQLHDFIMAAANAADLAAVFRRFSRVISSSAAGDGGGGAAAESPGNGKLTELLLLLLSAMVLNIISPRRLSPTWRRRQYYCGSRPWC